MARPLEIAYYNSIILSGGALNGAYHIEESRIKGEFNGASMDYGAKAYATDEEYGPRRRSKDFAFKNKRNMLVTEETFQLLMF